MAEKMKLQDEELNQVSGGCEGDEVQAQTCRSCGQRFEPVERDGSRIVINNGCGKSSDVYYVCPKCGYKWKV